MDKSPDAFRTISEVAEHLETPAHVLRFWESRFPQIRPVKRAGGRRYYRPSDVSLLTGIKRLLHDEGMTIRGVQKILREQGVRHVAGLSGEAMVDDPDAQAPFVDQVEDAVVVTVAKLPVRPPAPGLTEAMAKAVEQRPHSGAIRMPKVSGPAAAPAQGALLLTPAPPPELESSTAADIPDAAWPEPLQPALTDGDAGPDSAAFPQASQQDAQVGVEPPAAQHPVPEPQVDKTGAVAKSVEREPAQDAVTDEHDRAALADSPASARSALPDSAQDSEDFDVEDFDNGAVTTVASRIRSLPSDASAAQVRVQLLSVVARMQVLRDRMADAARSGRS